jgi:hypothetical protein
VDRHLHFIADDFQRRAMIQTAMRKAIELARDNFFHGLGADALLDDDVALFAGEAWKAYDRVIEFDYPTYAQSLFFKAYQMAYQVYQRELPHGIHPSSVTLAEEFEEQAGLLPHNPPSSSPA